MRVSVVVFPGSVGTDDAVSTFGHILGATVARVWHQDQDLQSPDLIIIPGGSAFGDVLRPGALAKLSPITDAIRKHAEKGGYVLGIGNGFQYLCETGLLPGCLLLNSIQKFIAKRIFVRTDSSQTPFFHNLIAGDVICLPIAHKYGRFYAPEEDLERLETSGQIALRYCTQDGELTTDANPNGSSLSIAGICDSRGHILGMMPHPERHVEGELGSEDGLALLGGILDYLVITRG